MKYHSTCPHCGAVTTAYLVRLNRALVVAFLVLADARIRIGHPIKKGDLELSNSQYGNFQKLRHFGLVEKMPGDLWEVTPFGWNFIRGRSTVLTPAGQFGNQTIPADHPAWATHDAPRKETSIRDILPEEWKRRADYVAEKIGA